MCPCVGGGGGHYGNCVSLRVCVEGGGSLW